MNETTITIRGWVGATPRLYNNNSHSEHPSGGSGTTTVFRVGVTPRRYSRARDSYQDGHTAWYSVRCYGALARHAATSLHTGMPVLIRGQLNVRPYTDSAGIERNELLVLADSIGVELATGTVQFAKHGMRSLTPVFGEAGEFRENQTDIQAENSEYGEPQAAISDSLERQAE
ncbi:single-stranded DNA-binding protein [Trueperella sp. LYQ143]|uniref:single-stranded DNA-binding protein n=1 Tax=unclassified Trueperella TaxID=2630174 RepID=UPI003982EE34